MQNSTAMSAARSQKGRERYQPTFEPGEVEKTQAG